MIIFGIGLIIASIGFVFHSWPRFFNRYFGIDSWRYLLVADYIRKNKKYPERMTHKYILEGPSDYPPIIMLFLSLFPKEWIDRNNGFISPFFNFLHSILIFTASYLLTDNLIIAILAQIIYLITPISAMEASNLNPRPLGVLLFSGMFLSFFLFIKGGHILWLISAFIFSVLIFLTHKMTAQAMILTMLFLGAVYKSWLYPVFLTASLLGAIVLSGGWYLRTIKGYYYVLQYNHNCARKFKLYHQVRGKIRLADKRGIIDRIKHLGEEAPIINLIAANPFILMVFPLIISQLARNYYFFNPLLSWMLWWSLALVLFAFLISHVPFLWLIGEGARYLEYSALPLSIISAKLIYESSVSNNKFLMILSVVIGLCSLIEIIFLQYRSVLKDDTRTMTGQLKKVIAYLENNNTGIRLMAIPHRYADVIGYFSPAKILCTDSDMAHYRYYPDFNPYLAKGLKYVVDKYGINHILIDNRYVQVPELNLEEGTYWTKFEAGNFILLGLK